jgi:Flp pilus assembly protein TadG
VIRARDERGSAVAFTVVFMAVFLAIATLVIDFGSWFTEQRRLQSAADAATLAAVQDLPNTVLASSSATTYANANVSGLNSWTPSFPNTNTIEVTLSKPAPGIFSKIFHIDSVTVHAHARAVVGAPARMQNVAPVAVKSTAACTTSALSCFGTTTTLNFSESNLSSSRFGLISLSCEGTTSTSCSSSGTGASDLETWIRSGYPDFLDIDKWYAAVTGEKIGPVRSALDDAGTAQTVLLFPVFDAADSTAMSFHILGWAAFVLDRGGVVSWKNDVPGCRPNCKLLRGRFVEYIAHGVDSTPGTTDFGVRVVNLVQ